MRTLPTEITVDCAAKVNIGWEVGERRADGFHDVRGAMQTISLADRLDFACEDSDEPRLRLVVPGHPELEGNNLVLGVAKLMASKAAARTTTITLYKHIPIGAGLGGGSADAAGALVGLNAAWGTGLSARQLLELGAEIGSDVPALMLGGLVHASGRGERVKRIGETSGYAFVLGIFNEEVSTPAVYAKLDEIREQAGSSDHGSTWHHNDLEIALMNLFADRDARVTFVTSMHSLRTAISLIFGESIVYVSGSGPTVVGIVPDPDRAAEIADHVRDAFPRVEVAYPTDWGVRLRLGT